MAGVSLERFQKIGLSQNLTEEQVKSLLPSVFEMRLEAGKILFKEGDPITLFFCVERGEIEEQGNLPDGRPNIPRRAKPGDYLGRYSLVTGQPSRITARAIRDTTLLAIPLRELQPILFSYPDWRRWFFRTDVATRLRAIPLFMMFDDWDLYFLADRVESKEFQAGQTIFRAGDPPDGIYVVDQGQVIETLPPTARPDEGWPRYYANGSFFGRHATLRGDPRQTTAAALLATRAFLVPTQTLKEILDTRGTDLAQELEYIDIAGYLQQIDLFSELPANKLRRLAGYVSLVYRAPGEIVSRQGDPATSLMILAEGEAIVRRQVGQGPPRAVAYLRAHAGEDRSSVQAQWQGIVYFGNHALLEEDIRGATVEVTEPSAWIVLQREDFDRFLDDTGLNRNQLKKGARPAPEQVPPPSGAERLELPFFTRRHPILLVTQVLPLAAILILVLLLIASDLFLFGLGSGGRDIVLTVSLVLLGPLALWTLWRFVNWRNDSLEVTNEVVAHVEKVPFPVPSEARYEVPLQQIQNVTIDISVLGRMFNFGDLSIDTAAIVRQLEFTQVPNPRAVHDLIQRAAAQARSGQEVQFRESIRERLEDQLFPERLKPQIPGSASDEGGRQPPKAPDTGRRRRRFHLIQLEIREDGRVTWRKHWFNLMQRVGLPFLSFVIMSALFLTEIGAFLAETAFTVTIALPLLSLLAAQAWLFFPIGFLWVLSVLWMVYQYVDWSNDVYIVTREEVIDVERNLAIFPLWFVWTESRRQAPLSRVQNVNLSMPNVVAFLFNFGDVIVQTAGLEGTLDFKFVSRPRQVQAEILRRLSEFQDRQRQLDFENRWRGMSEWFEAYEEIRRHHGD
jgi:CRP-like cAMP-binding protein/membrane protein YdbS with pleckstrin-like domain